jgi:hypothetical protein
MFALLFTILTFFSTPQAILITIDGVRYQEIYQGTEPSRFNGRFISAEELVPNLYQSFVKEGVALGKGTPMVASGPNFVSLPGYLEILGGFPSGCENNYCKPVITQSLFLNFEHPVVFSSWQNIIKTLPPGQTIYKDIPSKYRQDNFTEELALNYLNNNSPDFIYISLGDTDQYAHYLNYPYYIKSLQNADKFIGEIVKRYPNSLIVVTTDHGRSLNFKDHGKDKQSQRVWMMMRGPGVPIKGFVNIKASLSDIYPTILGLSNSILKKL